MDGDMKMAFLIAFLMSWIIGWGLARFLIRHRTRVEILLLSILLVCAGGILFIMSRWFILPVVFYSMIYVGLSLGIFGLIMRSPKKE
jgi:hypothetical protein